jgi:DNA helicase-2/ATP-dependent DNA helicase PcrA
MVRTPADGTPGHVSAAVPESPNTPDAWVPAGLSPAQREAVSAPDRVLCVLAGAGTGKTRVLTLRVARRVHDGTADPHHVLVCTFSRKAADELRRRLWALHVGDEVRAGTFHRTALHLLGQYRADRGLPPPVLVADRRTTLGAVVGLAATSTEGSDPRRPTARRAALPRLPAPGSARIAQLEAEIGWAKARLVEPERYEEAARTARRRPSMGAARVADLYGRYEEAKRRQGVLDLDDLLWACADALEADERFAAAVRWRFRHVFVDEMQDVNPAQFRLLEALLGDDPDLFVVGDPHQSVYGWNGADPGILGRVAELFPAARVVRLGENHRCSPQVVTVAAAALGLSGEAAPTSSRPDGLAPRVRPQATDAEEAAWVARQVWLAHRPGRRWSQIAVLARTNAQLNAVHAALAAERVPARLAGGDLGPASDLRQPEAGSADPDDRPEHTWRDATDDAVVLTTFHRAKGLQWPVVFVIGLSDGLVPIASARTTAARDEERRLLYVALTRAEDELSCTWSAHRDEAAVEAGTAPRRPSPWLDEVARASEAMTPADQVPDPATVAARLAELRSLLPGTLEVGG